jgi:hypothetical protein
VLGWNSLHHNGCIAGVKSDDALSAVFGKVHNFTDDLKVGAYDLIEQNPRLS